MKKIRLGIFGAGRGMRLSGSFQMIDALEIVAICDNHKKRREDAVKHIGGDIAEYEITKIPSVSEVSYIKSIPLSDGCIDIDVDVSLYYPCDIDNTTEEIKKVVNDLLLGLGVFTEEN